MQTYHSNAKTNASHRTFFQANKNRLSNAELAKQFNVSTKTIDKWKNRVTTKDLSSCRKSIRRSYSQWQENLVICLCNLTQWSKEDILEALATFNSAYRIKPSTVYNIFVNNNISRPTQESKALYKTFKE